MSTLSFILTTILSTFLYADNCQEDLCLTLGNVSDVDNTVEILYTANNDNITNIWDLVRLNKQEIINDYNNLIGNKNLRIINSKIER